MGVSSKHKRPCRRQKYSRYHRTHDCHHAYYLLLVTIRLMEWLGSRVVSVLDSGAEAPGFKSQPRRCRVTVLGKLFTPIVPLFIKQLNW